MQARTYLRVLFNNIFHENILSKVLSALINFCYEFNILNKNELKYNKRVPLSMADTKKNLFFQSVAGDRIDCQ